MHTVTLTKVLDPDRKIVAIKNLRNATRPPEGVAGTVMGLREAKDTVDHMVSYNAHPTVEVYDLGSLTPSFSFTDATPGLNKDDVLQFVFDVLSWSDPETANLIRSQPSYQRLVEALR